MKGLGDEAVQVVVQEAADRAKAEYIVGRGTLVAAAVGDEELVLDPRPTRLALKLTREAAKPSGVAERRRNPLDLARGETARAPGPQGPPGSRDRGA